MSTTEYAARPVPEVLAHEVTAPRQTKRWIDWILTTDHKRIGIMYLVTTFVFFMLGGVEALLMRSQLSVPNNSLVTAEHYNQLLTLHGTTMVFLFVVPVMAGFGNYFVPTAHGSPVLWQHLFWFFGHPEVYIMILPGFGIISEVIPVFSRKPVFGYKAIAASTAVIAFLATLVWAHHLFASPIPIVVLGFFMLSSFLIGIPTGVKIFNWVATLWRGSIVTTTALYFACGMIAIFLLGGITGIFLAVFPVDWQLNATYFVVAHFHYVLMGGAVFSIFSGLYYWFPKMTGRLLNERLGKISFWVMFIGFNMTFFVQHALGLSGMPRRIFTYSPGLGWSTYNLISSIGSYILGLGIVLTIINVAINYK